MRGQWQSQTRRLNRHYQSVKDNTPRPISGIIDINSLTGYDYFEQYYQVIDGSTLTMRSQDSSAPISSANTYANPYTSPYTGSRGYEGMFGYDGEPKAAKLQQQGNIALYDLCKTTFNPIGNIFTFVTQIYDNYNYGYERTRIIQEVDIPLLPKSDFPDYTNGIINGNYLNLRINNYRPLSSTQPGEDDSTYILLGEFEIDSIITHGDFSQLDSSTFEYDVYDGSVLITQVIFSGNFSTLNINTKNDLRNYLNQEFIYVINPMTCVVGYSTTSCKYKIPSFGWTIVNRYDGGI